MKPGYKTTEFWLTALATILAMLMMSGAISDGGLAAKIVGGAIAILAQLGYTAARAAVKSGEARTAGLVDVTAAAIESEHRRIERLLGAGEGDVVPFPPPPQPPQPRAA
jgi:hypothetical protein